MMATEAQILDRLSMIIGKPGERISSLVIRSIEDESEGRKIKYPQRCVVTACSRPEEELARWRFMEDEEVAKRSIAAARQVVNRYLKQMGFEGAAVNWNLISKGSEDG